MALQEVLVASGHMPVAIYSFRGESHLLFRVPGDMLEDPGPLPALMGGLHWSMQGPLTRALKSQPC